MLQLHIFQLAAHYKSVWYASNVFQIISYDNEIIMRDY